MVKLLLAILVLLDVFICFSFFVENKGSSSSFVVWQIAIIFAVCMIMFYRNVIKEIKPD